MVPWEPLSREGTCTSRGELGASVPSRCPLGGLGCPVGGVAPGGVAVGLSIAMVTMGTEQVAAGQGRPGREVLAEAQCGACSRASRRVRPVAEPPWGPLQINKLHLCRPLIRAIDSSNLKDDYSTAQRVTFRYYVGRKAMFDSDFKQGGLAAAAAAVFKTLGPEPRPRALMGS